MPAAARDSKRRPRDQAVAPKVVRWRSASIPGFEIAYCDDVEFDARQRFVFEAYSLTLVGAGRGAFMRAKRWLDDVGPGSIAVSAPGDVVAAQSRAGGISCRNLYLSPALVRELAESESGPNALDRPQRSTRPVDPGLFRELDRSTRELDHDPSALGRDARLLLGLASFVRGVDQLRTEPRRNERFAVRRARELLLDRLDENVSLEQLARASRLNRCYLLRVFAQEVGLPPHRYQQHARIGKARALLANGRSALEAAIEVGFTDQAHFTHVFKSQLGVTPGAYRAMFVRH
jgi:AraC-like DNA-binding protein